LGIGRNSQPGLIFAMGRLAVFAPLVATLVLASACAPLLPPPVSPKPQVAPKPAPVAAKAAPVDQKLSLVKTSFAQVPGWRGDRHVDAIAPLLKSCRRIAKLKDGQSVAKANQVAIGTAATWRPICAAAAKLGGVDAALVRDFFETWFEPHLATANGRPEGLFTGYFEMELKGSWIKTGAYTTPVYERPPDIIEARLDAFRPGERGTLVGKISGKKFVPYDTRGDIDGGSIAKRGQAVLWVDSAVDAFFLHVQGSGRVAMDDGSIVRLGFSGRNGQPYRSIGGELIRRGELTRERTSMQSIRAWLREHPDQAGALMATNPSYIFFRVVEGALKSLKADQGPVGAAGVPLTPGRSLAVDLHFIPLGLPVWLDTTDPLNPGDPLRRIVITQDTGAAIKGPVRGDLFWGFGEAAATRAGLMKEPGRYFLLLPKRR